MHITLLKHNKHEHVWKIKTQVFSTPENLSSFLSNKLILSIKLLSHNEIESMAVSQLQN